MGIWYYFQRIFAKKLSHSEDVQDSEHVATSPLRWDSFLHSYTYLKVRAHFDRTISKPGRRIPCQLLVLPYWQEALTMACRHWHIYDEEANFIHKSRGQDIEEIERSMWETIVFLILGTYFVQNGRSLAKMTQSIDESLFLLHAATDVLSTSCEYMVDDDFASISSSSTLYVFHRVLEQYSEQMEMLDPFQGRLPIHIAAANIACAGHPSLPSGLPVANLTTPEDYSDCPLEILEAIVSKCPNSAASLRDGRGLFPLQLAAMSGYSWSTGLEALFRMAPDVVDDDISPPLLILASEKVNLTSLFLLIQAAPQLVQQAILSTTTGTAEDEDAGNSIA